MIVVYYYSTSLLHCKMETPHPQSMGISTNLHNGWFISTTLEMKTHSVKEDFIYYTRLVHVQIHPHRNPILIPNCMFPPFIQETHLLGRKHSATGNGLEYAAMILLCKQPEPQRFPHVNLVLSGLCAHRLLASTFLTSAL